MELGEPLLGKGIRSEITRDVVAGASEIGIDFYADEHGPTRVGLQWWGVGDKAMLSALEKNRAVYDSEWDGLILPEVEWPELKFTRGLLFDEADLEGLRRKTDSPTWKEHFRVLEKRARDAMSCEPETEIRDVLPGSDLRYIREREHDGVAWHTEGALCALVGLVRNDRAMQRQALCFLMCYVHTKHWISSMESRARGISWDTRCFTEEISVTTCALIYDWLGSCLTERARDLVRVAIWDKGLSVIQRDMVKWEYVYSINQGPWFCRARIFGGLVLEQDWPRVKPYIEQGFADMLEGLNTYLLPDGGVDEGLSYFDATFKIALPGLRAYTRARGCEMAAVLPPNLQKSVDFISVMSAMKPGSVLLDGDNMHGRLGCDIVALLAELCPHEAYTHAARETLLKADTTYFDRKMFDGIASFILAPDEFPESRCIVPEFGHLPHTGHITSRRKLADGHQVRLHLAGCKARPSHSHFDKGNLTLELDEEPVLIDRGVIRYDDARINLLKRTELHNVLAPVRVDGSFVNQSWADAPVIPKGHGDAKTFTAKMDLVPVWRGVMSRCSRSVTSLDASQFTVIDSGELLESLALVFNLQTRNAWAIDVEAKRAELLVAGWKLTIHVPWADEISQAENLIDHRMEPVWHLQCRREAGEREFTFETRFTVELLA